MRKLPTLSRLLRVFCFTIFGAYIGLALNSSVSSGPVWDDEIEYIGLIDQISFAKHIILSGFNPDLDYESAISTNLEFYGIINKIAGLFFYRLAGSILTSIKIGDFSDEFLGTVLINKFVTVSLFAGCIYSTYLIGKRLGLKHPTLAPILLIGFPTIIGHSWLNIKDIPFAFSYTLFTLCSIYYITQGRTDYLRCKKLPTTSSRILSSPLFLAFSGSLTVACRPAFMPVAIFTVFVCTVLRFCSRKTHISSLPKSFLVISGFILMFSSALIPASWINPFDYFAKSIQIHSRHPWGGAC